jgi:hypothetical protein
MKYEVKYQCMKASGVNFNLTAFWIHKSTTLPLCQ